MPQEIFLGDKLDWPKPHRCAVNLVFNYQGAEGLEPDRDGRIGGEEYAKREYGPRVGIWRILRVLEKYKVKATFVTCGAIAARYPETVEAIDAAGHDIGGHGYNHEKAWRLTPQQELDTIHRTVDAIGTLTNERIEGWRCCFQSKSTPQLVVDEGFNWNSNTFSHDYPYLLKEGDKVAIEIPRHPFGDMFIFEVGKSTNPDDALTAWKKAFDTIYDESSLFPTFVQFSLHPFIVGRPGRIEALSEMLEYINGHERVWMPTCDEVAKRVTECAGDMTASSQPYPANRRAAS